MAYQGHSGIRHLRRGLVRTDETAHRVAVRVLVAHPDGGRFDYRGHPLALERKGRLHDHRDVGGPIVDAPQSAPHRAAANRRHPNRPHDGASLALHYRTVPRTACRRQVRRHRTSRQFGSSCCSKPTAIRVRSCRRLSRSAARRGCIMRSTIVRCTSRPVRARRLPLRVRCRQ